MRFEKPRIMAQWLVMNRRGKYLFAGVFGVTLASASLLAQVAPQPHGDAFIVFDHQYAHGVIVLRRSVSRAGPLMWQ